MDKALYATRFPGLVGCTRGRAASARQQIFYGAPGTGKSFNIGQHHTLTKDNTYRVTFHPDTDYASFVGCYKPSVKAGSSEITYEFSPQAFTNAYVAAWKTYKSGEPVYLLIDEINRGNCAQIFGDLFQLLDRDSRGFSQYEIVPDKDLEKYLAGKINVSGVTNKEGEDISDEINEGELLKLPSNLYILATMNTSDQSLYRMDSAFKRRWAWEYVPINYDEPLANVVLDIAGLSNDKWMDIVKKINAFIRKELNSTAKQIGQWFVIPEEDATGAYTKVTFKEFRDKVLFYLFNDAFKNMDNLNAPFGQTADENIFLFEDLLTESDQGVDKCKEFVEYLLSKY